MALSDRITQRLAELERMSAAELRTTWSMVMETAAPPLSADLLRRAIAWRLQERALGGLPATARRDLARMAEQLARSGMVSTQVHAGRIKPGTRLVRDWGGSSHHVIVLDLGYHYRGQTYTSLSHIARKITGAHWSGPRFFGIVAKRAMSDG